MTREVETTGRAIIAKFKAKHGLTRGVTAPRRVRNRPEQALQRACVDLLAIYENMKLLRFTHVPNGGRRGKVEAAIFKALGVRAGFPDLIILPRNRRAGIILAELKSAQGGLSKPQEGWRDWLLDAGYCWVEIRNVDDLKTVLLTKRVI